MDSDEVQDALGRPLPGGGRVAANGMYWQRYQDTGLTCIYEREMILVAVAVDALEGPLVQVGGVELIDRVPSEARVEIHDLAGREGVEVRVNWSGDPEVVAWGVSMGTAQKYVLSAEGHVQRPDEVITDTLFVGAELADDPYAAPPVMHWRDVREQGSNPGAWPVKPDQDRPRWEWAALERVGPLRFGMTPPQVSAALDDEIPAGRIGSFPFWWPGEDGPWNPSEDRFEEAGVSAHYSTYPDGVPRLGAVTLHGRTGPQAFYACMPLVGVTPSVLDAAIIEHLEKHDLGLRFSPSGAAGSADLNLTLGTARVGDATVSEPTFHAEHWEI
ncbi:hypothetical protein AB0P15_36650 [Streptomyces sp. NPDC087917]|uniref:hypothetical protein n=1 Tax=Streptomyces sp. NPDC087917 TaxID=3155060 RepID=UPI00341D026E